MRVSITSKKKTKKKPRELSSCLIGICHINNKSCLQSLVYQKQRNLIILLKFTEDNLYYLNLIMQQNSHWIGRMLQRQETMQVFGKLALECTEYQNDTFFLFSIGNGNWYQHFRLHVVLDQSFSMMINHSILSFSRISKHSFVYFEFLYKTRNACNLFMFCISYDSSFELHQSFCVGVPFDIVVA